MEDTLKSTGGYLKEIKVSTNYEGILHTILQSLYGYDIVFLINSGSNQVKSEWERWISGILGAIGDNSASRFGIINVYSGTKANIDGAAVTVSDWYNKQSFWSFTKDSNLIKNRIENIKAMDQPCVLQTLEFGGAADNFDKEAFEYTDGLKTVLLISDSVLSDKSAIRKNIDDKIPLYVIYVGPEITDSRIKTQMINLVESTGGLVLFIDDNNHKKVNIDGTETELSIMEKFNDAISFMINASLHASDDLDSDRLS